MKPQRKRNQFVSLDATYNHEAGRNSFLMGVVARLLRAPAINVLEKPLKLKNCAAYFVRYFT